jgi:hypothetical protein
MGGTTCFLFLAVSVTCMVLPLYSRDVATVLPGLSVDAFYNFYCIMRCSCFTVVGLLIPVDLCFL